ncbi:MAG TPA: WecB/TagA/CpsF family glycosyltransferase [Nitrospiria bacterium]|nr:WecB/TagA/CpsF family glycosyltransferase [Nitrospiria bacterium]HUK56447.1 WecB/TagA/CpsF family glycosyltransferase [Nitrospiria bacterium]
MPQPLKLLGVKVDRATMEETIDAVKALIRSHERRGRYLCVANVHSVVCSRRNEKIKAVMNASWLTVADGMPLLWSAGLLGCPIKERVAGPDLMTNLLGVSEKEGFKNFFYGSSDAVLTALSKNLTERFPRLRIVGAIAPPFRPLTPAQDLEIVEAIHAASPDILWVGLGAPKQELWMAEHSGRLRVPVMIGVGAAFDFHAGHKSRAPLWMQKSGLEWAWRLYQEPGRLWKRYLIDDLPFFWYILKQKYIG